MQSFHTKLEIKLDWYSNWLPELEQRIFSGNLRIVGGRVDIGLLMMQRQT